jgi:uncharacterized lipoprotein YajG
MIDIKKRFCIHSSQRKLDAFKAILLQENQDIHTMVNYAMYNFIIDKLQDQSLHKLIYNLFKDDIKTAKLSGV